MIFILDRQEKVINILKNNGGVDGAPPFFDDTLTEDLSTGSETFQFTTIGMGNVSRDLIVGNYVAFKKNDKYKLFQIMQVEETHDEVIYITVYCEGAGLELINKVFRKRTMNSTSLKTFLTTILNDTGWNVGFIDGSSVNTVDLELEDSTVYATLQNNIGKYNCELEFRVEIRNGRIAEKFVDAYGNRGKVTGKRFVFGQDIEGLTRKTDSTELYTALVGRGKNGLTFRDVTISGIDKPAGQDFVADQSSYERYNHNGYHIMGIYEYDTESPEELLRETYKQLQKVKTPKYEYEVSVALLGNLLGEKWNSVAIGDTVAIVDNAFNPPIHLMARVSKLETSFTNPQGDACTLSNFIEVKSNITDEMRKIASQLEGYVDGAIDNKFPIGGEDIKEGAVNSTHIYQNSITTDHLIADCVTADKIKANQITTEHLQADSIKSQHISAEQIEAEHIKSGTITADQIATGTITAESGIIADATIGTAQIKDAEITVAKIQNAFVDSLVANQGKFQSAHIGVLTSNNIDAKTIKAEHIQSSVIDAINLNVEGKISADKIEAIKMEIEEIDAGKITTGTLDADRITSSVITAINGSIENATINEAKIGKLSADKISASVIDAINMNVSGKISANRIDVDSLKVNEIDASRITSGYLNSDRIEAGSIDAEKLSVDTINAIGISASEITANKIASGEIKVGNANIVDGTISGLKVAKGTITNAQIKDATIESAKIKEINAEKVNTGTLDATKVRIASSSGNLTIQDNTIQIMDNQKEPKTRVQIGKDNNDNYGILVMNQSGEIIFDSDVGVYEEGIKDSAVSTNKIRENAIDSSKLNVDELFVGDNAFIKSLKAVEIDASNIVTGTISNERIDITGLVSFEAFDDSLKPMFDVQGNKTYINGGVIATNTIKADKIDLLSGITVQGEDGSNTFSIASNGEVEVNGLLKSGNFDEEKNTGYKLSTDGKAILNQAIVKGDVILQNAGITSFGGIIGSPNVLSHTDYTVSTISDIFGSGGSWIKNSLLNASISKYGHGNAHEIDKHIANMPILNLRYEATESVNQGYFNPLGQNNTEYIELIPNTIYTFSAWIYQGGVSAGSSSLTVWGYDDDGTNRTSLATKYLTSQWTGDFRYVTFTFTTDNRKYYQPRFYLNAKSGVTEGAVNFLFYNMKLEVGDTATPYCPSENDAGKYVRIWAGSTYENRNNAKFRVYNNGDIYATDGTFSGKMYGDLDSGLIHIHNNEIVINSTESYIDEHGIERNIQVADFNPNPYLRLGAGTSLINTDLILGSMEDKRVEFSNENRELTLNQTALKLESPIKTSGGASVYFNPNGIYNSAFGVKSNIEDTDASLTIGYHNGSWANTTIITHTGSRGGANGDICFKRTDNTENLNVYVQGNMKVKNSIQSSIQNIEMRSVSNEGWGFYAT